MFDDSEIFKDLTFEEKGQLEIFCQKKILKKGDKVFEEGEEANSMYILQEGEIEVYRKKLGEKIIIGNIEAEDILGEMAIFGLNGKRMASAIAKKDSILITILSFSIKELTLKSPGILNKIQGIIEIRNIQNKKML